MSNNQQSQQAAQTPAQGESRAIVRQQIAIASDVNALVPSSLEGAWQLAQWLSKSSLIPKYKDKEADIFLIITSGMELGLPPNASLRGLYCVNGRVALESKTKAALCISKGAALYFKRTEYNENATTWETMRAGQAEPVRMRYTKAEATAAGLTKKEGPWQGYPQRMISHRALGWLCDDVYPDIVLGVATAEDFDEFTGNNFREIGDGMSVSTMPPAATPPPSDVVPGVPAGTKDGNAKKPDAPADMDEPTVIALIADMKKCMKKSELKAIGEKRIHGKPMSDATRARLLEVYETQVDLIDAADRDTEHPNAPTRKDS